jgi:hypothetical protein
MSNDFKQLKKQSSLGSQTEKLLKKLEESTSYGADTSNVFKLETDKMGNGRAVIRFLPAPPGEEDPFVKLYNHGFQHNGKWFIENCPTTVGRQCELCTRNSELWNSGVEADKEIARNRKRKLSYYSNIFVISNPANPELEGQVMLFRYGAKIFDKIKSAMKPEFEEDTPIDAFDFWTGADFRLRVKQVAGYPNYDDSSFASISVLNGDDDKLKEIWEKEYSLQELISADKFKGEEEFTKRLDFVLGNKQATVNSDSDSQEEELDMMKELEETYASRSGGSSEEEDALAYFENLAAN